MDLVSYRGIPMRIVQSLPHLRMPELDESRATYKWTRCDFSFIVTLEPAALSAIPAQLPDTGATIPNTANAADFQAGRAAIPPTMPGQTDAAIRRFLEYPRGTLIIRSIGIDQGGNQQTTIVLQ